VCVCVCACVCVCRRVRGRRSLHLRFGGLNGTVKLRHVPALVVQCLETLEPDVAATVAEVAEMLEGLPLNARHLLLDPTHVEQQQQQGPEASETTAAAAATTPAAPAAAAAALATTADAAALATATAPAADVLPLADFLDRLACCIDARDAKRRNRRLILPAMLLLPPQKASSSSSSPTHAGGARNNTPDDTADDEEEEAWRARMAKCPVRPMLSVLHLLIMCAGMAAEIALDAQLLQLLRSPLNATQATDDACVQICGVLACSRALLLLGR
jgi:hypothetical protein